MNSNFLERSSLSIYRNDWAEKEQQIHDGWARLAALARQLSRLGFLLVKADTEQVEMGTKPVSDMALTQDKAQTGRLTPGSLHIMALYKQSENGFEEELQGVSANNVTRDSLQAFWQSFVITETFPFW